MALRKTNTTKNDPRSGSTTLCKDIPAITGSFVETRIKKKKGESNFAAYKRFSQDEADGWCESGLCSSGKCRGQRETLEGPTFGNATEDYVVVSFKMNITCKCE